MKRLRSLFENDLPAGCLYFAAWIAVSALAFVVTTKILQSLMLLAIGFLLVYPVCCFIIAFRYTKYHGVKWYFYLAVAAVTLIEYFLLGFDVVEPNYIATTAVTMFFGGGLGRQFSVAAARKASKKHRDEKEYKKILDD